MHDKVPLHATLPTPIHFHLYLHHPWCFQSHSEAWHKWANTELCLFTQGLNFPPSIMNLPPYNHFGFGNHRSLWIMVYA